MIRLETVNWKSIFAVRLVNLVLTAFPDRLLLCDQVNTSIESSVTRVLSLHQSWDLRNLRQMLPLALFRHL